MGDLLMGSFQLTSSCWPQLLASFQVIFHFILFSHVSDSDIFHTFTFILSYFHTFAFILSPTFQTAISFILSRSYFHTFTFKFPRSRQRPGDIFQAGRRQYFPGRDGRGDGLPLHHPVLLKISQHLPGKYKYQC